MISFLRTLAIDVGTEGSYQIGLIYITNDRDDVEIIPNLFHLRSLVSLNFLLPIFSESILGIVL